MKKFNYIKPNMNKIIKEYDKLLNDFNIVNSLEEQLNIIEKINQIRDNFFSMYWISHINYYLNVNDDFWIKEEQFFIKNDPIMNNYKLKYYNELLKSKYRKELERIIGSKVFLIALLVTKMQSDNIIELLNEENKLKEKYSKLIIDSKVLYEGNEISLSILQKYIYSSNREERIKANIIKSKCLKNIENEIDNILSNLITIRNKIAKELKYDSYSNLSYVFMKRIGYGRKDIELFRNEVIKYIVPYINKLKEKQKKELNVDELYYYDNPILFNGKGAYLKGNTNYIIEQALKMYKKISPKIYEVFKLMIDNDVIDLDARKGKIGCGVTTYIPNEKLPVFITDFNGTSRDIQVLTHEFGHSLQLYFSRNLKYYENWWPTYDTCEIHSKSMELLCLPYTEYFFGKDKDNYIYESIYNVLNEMCYSCLIDEFQHILYDKPNMNNKSRKRTFRQLEKKYMPWLNYKDNDYLEVGNAYQNQLHIFNNPFYYIDYALSDTIALQFYIESINDKEKVWDKYIEFCSNGGIYSFIDSLKNHELKSPFEKDVLKDIINKL